MGITPNLKNNFLFDMLKTHLLYWISKYPNLQFLISGDFNIVLNSSLGRWPPSTDKSPPSNLTTFTHKFNLIDLWGGRERKLQC